MKRVESSNRILSVVALATTLFVLLFSVFLISEHALHRCDDEDNCPICAIIVQCQQNLKTIGSSIIVAAVLFAAFYLMSDTPIAFVYQSVQTTLVSQRVRLNN